jgi:putative chitinase
MPMAQAQAWAQPMSDAMAKWRILSVSARAAFLAVCGEESGSFVRYSERKGRERLNYTAQGLANTWKRFSSTGQRGGAPNQAALDLAARGERAIANVVYDSPEMGNVDRDDGWDFRGGGPIQVTWRTTWQDCATAHGHTFDRNGLAAWAETASDDPAQAASCSAWFFAVYKRGILPLVDTGDEAAFLEACKLVGTPPNQGVIDTWLRLWRAGLRVLK